MILCTCCSAEITCPQFHDGKPYGYTCIKKVAPAQKRYKVEYKACDSFKLVGDRSVTTRLECYYVFEGKKHSMIYYVDQTTGVCNPMSGYIDNGVLYLPFKSKK